MEFAIEPLELRQLLAAVPHLAVSTPGLAFSQPMGTVSHAQYVTLKNTGQTTLRLYGVAIAGNNAADFGQTTATPKTLAPGKSITLQVVFKPTAAEVDGATLLIASNDPTSPLISVALRGLGLKGYYGDNEPSLQRILDTFQIPDNVGDSNPATSKLDLTGGPTDEVPMQLFQKAGAGPVTISLLAVFGWDHTPVCGFGWYTPASTPTQHGLFYVREGNSQMICPPAVGTGLFDPGSATFGLFSTWPAEHHGPTYSEDWLNTWDTVDANQHAIRVYPMKNAARAVVPNQYVMGIEEAFNSDFQDAVLLVKNIAPVGGSSFSATAAAVRASVVVRPTATAITNPLLEIGGGSALLD